jgi:hypothetical protein
MIKDEIRGGVPVSIRYKISEGGNRGVTNGDV